MNVLDLELYKCGSKKGNENLNFNENFITPWNIQKIYSRSSCLVVLNAKYLTTYCRFLIFPVQDINTERSKFN